MMRVARPRGARNATTRFRATALVALLALSACAGPATPGSSFGPAFSFAADAPDGVAATSAPDAIDFDPGTNMPPGLAVFDPWFITDPMAGDQVALRYLVPVGWRSVGQVVWMPEWSRLVDLQTRASDPVSGATVEWLPVQDFLYFQPPAGLEPPIGANYQGKAFVPPITDPAQFVSSFWMGGPLAHLADATLVSIVQQPQVADDFVTQFGAPANAAAYRMRYSYFLDGQPWDEDVSFALLFSSANGMESWYVNFAYTTRAPQGLLEAMAPTLSTIVASRTTTPEWEATFRLTQGLFYQGIQQQMADTQAFGQLLAQHRAESQALQQQIVAERNASQDRIADLRGQVLAGIDTFVDPLNQRLVQLPAGQGTYWVNAGGQYIASDQPGFDPATQFGGTWTLLQQRP